MAKRVSLEEDIEFISKLIDSLEEAEEKLQESHSRGNREEFEETKRFMKSLQKEIGEAL